MPGMLGQYGDTLEDDYKWGALRTTMARNDPMQAVIGPLSHRAFVREAVRENPAAAIPLAAAIPAYNAAKRVGEIAQERPAQTLMMPGSIPILMLLNKMGFFPRRARSPASLDDIFASYEGMFSGLKDYATRK